MQYIYISLEVFISFLINKEMSSRHADYEIKDFGSNSEFNI